MTKDTTKPARATPGARRKRWLPVVAGLLLAALVLALPVARVVRRHLYPRGFSAEVERWAEEYSVDPLLVYAVIRTESGFGPNAQSTAGARGLMQMTEDTFNWVKGLIARDETLGFDDLYRPEVNIRFGVYYLARCLARYAGDVPTAAAAYHSGWGTVDRLLAAGEHTDDGVVLTAFPYGQMRHYVHKIANNYASYQKLYA